MKRIKNNARIIGGYSGNNRHVYGNVFFGFPRILILHVWKTWPSQQAPLPLANRVALVPALVRTLAIKYPDAVKQPTSLYSVALKEILSFLDLFWSIENKEFHGHNRLLWKAS